MKPTKSLKTRMLSALLLLGYAVSHTQSAANPKPYLAKATFPTADLSIFKPTEIRGNSFPRPTGNSTVTPAVVK